MRHVRRQSRMGRLIAAAASMFLATGLALVPLASVLACSCMMLQPGDALRNAQVAFVGVVAAARDPSAGNPVINTMEPIIYTLVVEEPMKGGITAGQQVTVSTSRDGASCGWPMEVGQRQRLYLSADQRSLSTSLCSGNELLAERVPIPQVSGPGGADLPIPLLVGAGAIGLVAAASGLAFLRWGRRPS